jgi:DNA-binding NarL/FixJ family response regulator
MEWDRLRWGAVADGIVFDDTDDDMMLRNMFSRVLKATAPTWKIKEASNGEAALKIVDGERFDLICVGQ